MNIVVNIGNLSLGSGCPVVVQSMTNTDTNDVEATVAQAKRMVAAGAEMVRITVPTLREVAALEQIKNRLRQDGCNVPLIADVHFSPAVAEACASIVEKVRINPGNYVDRQSAADENMSDSEYQAALDKMAAKARPLFDICRKHGTTLRIGTNHGSLSRRIIGRYGNTPRAMAQSAMEWVDICRQNQFDNIVLSMKSSNVSTMIEATLLLYSMMADSGAVYPLHLGVTEAGAGLEGRCKSAAGIGALLLQGIGNTIRVSLTEPPENETPFAHCLLRRIELIKKWLQTGKLPYQLDEHGTITIHSDATNLDELIADVASTTAYAHFIKHDKINDLQIINTALDSDSIEQVKEATLQACRIKMSQTEFISCPSCGRTRYDIMSVLEIVKQRFAHYPGLKIGVMGCIVNGPGEMADADFGIVGGSEGKVVVYRGKERLSDNLPLEEALCRLEELCEEWKRNATSTLTPTGRLRSGDSYPRADQK
ncbi:MAG: (E)-4-hydroxy-3-methylbut-2-enyl-diphosphate synthase [Bacteroidales bacterium]|nr:(E)-4-hydroxy-3-methylbut-2-enyl-diphosphate synthase [Bacteroidales bacterium]